MSSLTLIYEVTVYTDIKHSRVWTWISRCSAERFLHLP